MRKIIVTAFLSLDGVMENPMWTMSYWNDEIARFKAEETTANDVLLLGRVTYEGFAAAWPQRTGEDTGATYFNGARKYVVTNTLDKADWNNTQIIKGDAAEEVRKLKQQGDENLVVHGSGKLVQTLIQHDLVDSYRLLIYPVVLGKGQRLFEDGTQTTLKLVESRNFSSGVVALIYEPAR
ncbi:MAG: dihydrofolate reductase family protein [Chloroflexota bacterium]|nr:dihydrofolate reductase family protein [Chloroflexota bacterium]